MFIYQDPNIKIVGSWRKGCRCLHVCLNALLTLFRSRHPPLLFLRRHQCWQAFISVPMHSLIMWTPPLRSVSGVQGCCCYQDPKKIISRLLHCICFPLWYPFILVDRTQCHSVGKRAQRDRNDFNVRNVCESWNIGSIFRSVSINYLKTKGWTLFLTDQDMWIYSYCNLCSVQLIILVIIQIILFIYRNIFVILTDSCPSVHCLYLLILDACFQRSPGKRRGTNPTHHKAA